MKRLSILLLTLALCSCQSEVPTPQANAAATVEFREIANVQQVMNWIMEPSADVVWDAVGTIITEEGEQNMRPASDEEWIAVRDAAAVVAESANLLLTPGRLRDRDDWVRHSHALTRAAQAAMAAAEAQDVDALFTAGGDIYLMCTECHAQYAIGLDRVQ